MTLCLATFLLTSTHTSLLQINLPCPQYLRVIHLCHLAATGLSLPHPAIPGDAYQGLSIVTLDAQLVTRSMGSQ